MGWEFCQTLEKFSPLLATYRSYALIEKGYFTRLVYTLCIEIIDSSAIRKLKEINGAGGGDFT